jgi:hypothetical protein
LIFTIYKIIPYPFENWYQSTLNELSKIFTSIEEIDNYQKTLGKINIDVRILEVDMGDDYINMYYFQIAEYQGEFVLMTFTIEKDKYEDYIDEAQVTMESIEWLN